MKVKYSLTKKVQYSEFGLTHELTVNDQLDKVDSHLLYDKKSLTTPYSTESKGIEQNDSLNPSLVPSTNHMCIETTKSSNQLAKSNAVDDYSSINMQILPNIPDKVTNAFHQISLNHPNVKTICSFMTENLIDKTKHDAEFPFSIIKADDGNFFAIYNDKKSLLGRGTEGKVKYVINLQTNKIFACKIVEHIPNSELKETLFLKKIGALRATLTRNVEVFLKTYLIIDLGARSLKAELSSMNKDWLLLASYKMLDEILKLHFNHNIAHGDYCSSNVLFDRTNGTMQIIDFGKSYDLTIDSNPEGKKKFDILSAVLQIQFLFKESGLIADSDVNQIMDMIIREIFNEGTFEKLEKSDACFKKYCKAMKNLDSINFNHIFNLILDKISDPILKKMIDKPLAEQPSLQSLRKHEPPPKLCASKTPEVKLETTKLEVSELLANIGLNTLENPVECILEEGKKDSNNLSTLKKIPATSLHIQKKPSSESFINYRNNKNQFFSTSTTDQSLNNWDFDNPPLVVLILAFCIPVLGWAFLFYLFLNKIEDCCAKNEEILKV